MKKYFAILNCSFLLTTVINAQIPDILLDGYQIGSGFGYSVASAGDVNNDGFEDVIVGSYISSNGESTEGLVYVYHGTPAGISTTPAYVLEINQAFAKFGSAVASAGDVNGDGYDDVIIGARDYDFDNGGAFIYHGSAAGLITTPAMELPGLQTWATAGYDVGCAGDVNNDGYDDVLVGIPGYDNGSIDEGIVQIYHGSPTGISAFPDLILECNQAYASFGISVAGAGDLNGDGFSDIIISASNYNAGHLDEGKVFIYHGSVTGINPIPVTTKEGNQTNAYFGSSVSSAGDINMDGFSDVIIGSYLYNNGENDEGAAFIYYGSVSGILDLPVSFLECDQASAYFGTAVSEAGDVNGDGFGDVIIGATGFTNGDTEEGRAFVFYGSADGINLIPDITYECNQQYSIFGKSVAPVGDLNNDGLADIIIGAYGFNSHDPDDGGAFIYYGNGCLTSNFYVDTDGDGFGFDNDPITSCEPILGFVTNNTDCNDLNALINPDILEICNSLDDNCNGLIDDDVIETISISAAGPTTFCQGASVILNATTSGPNYQWKKNGTNIPGAILSSYTATTKGTYTCQTSSACDTELSTGIFVNVQKNPPASITAGGATTFCAGGSVILTANTAGGLSYKWYKNAVLIPGATSINYTATTAGIYKCNVTKTASGCNKNSNGIIVTVPCREDEELISNNNSFNIYPNPNNGTFTISASSAPLRPLRETETTSIEIYNPIGQQIYSQQLNSTNKEINETIYLGNVPNGIYFVRLNNSEQKLIIEK